MTKKFVIATIIAVILSLSFGICFANEENSSNKVNLGNEITKSLDKTGDNAKHLVDNAMNSERKMMNSVENAGKSAVNGIEDIGKKAENVTSDVAGAVTRTGYNNYIATRTTADDVGSFAGMTSTTWMWLIFTVAAVIIIAAIWYYSVQNKDNRE